MSTKIYDAFRVKKSTDILELLFDIRSIYIQSFSDSKSAIEMIHISVIEMMVEKKMDEKLIHNHLKGDIDLWSIVRFIKEAELDPCRFNPLSVECSCSIFYDRRYWYLKFFNNTGWQAEALNQSINKYNLEDFHYQNQSDPPEDIPYRQYEARDKKWNSLLRNSGGTYRSGFIYILFDSHEFQQLVSKNYYRGLKTNEELYSHLAYKFPDKSIKKGEIKS